MSIELYNEDCKETMKRIPDGSIDLMLTDIPYGTTQNEWDVLPNLAEMWLQWERILKPNGAWIFTSTMNMATDIISPRRGFFRYDIIWQKSHDTGFLNAKKMPLRSHENILVFYRSLPTYNPQIKDKPICNIRPKSASRLSTNYGDFESGDYRTIPIDKQYPKSIWKCNIDQKQVHPTQKPVTLFREIIRTYSNEGETVYDGYSGSGTTAIACIKEKRNFIGAEMNKEYYDKSMERIKIEQSQLVLF